jgi:importin-5
MCNSVSVSTLFIIASIPHLLNVINAEGSRSEENIMATENAIAAIGKVIKTYKDTPGFDTNANITAWIQSLPIIEDSEEAPDAYSLLLELVNGRHPAVANVAQIPKLCSVLIQALCIPNLMPKNTDINQQLLVTLRSIIAACDGSTKQALWSSLTLDQQQYLQSQGLA